MGTMTPASSNLSSSCSTFWRRAYGTDLGLKKRGRAAVLIWSFASTPLILPNSGLNTVWCRCKTSCRLSWACTLKMCFHSSFNLASQSHPNRLGPSLATATRGSSSSWPWYCTLIISFPTTGIASPVYVRSFTSVG